MLKLPVLNSKGYSPGDLGGDFRKWSKTFNNAGLLKPGASLKKDNQYDQKAAEIQDPRGAAMAYVDKEMPASDRFREFYDDDTLNTQFAVDNLTLAKMKKEEPLAPDMLLDPYARRTQNFVALMRQDIRSYYAERDLFAPSIAPSVAPAPAPVQIE